MSTTNFAIDKKVILWFRIDILLPTSTTENSYGNETSVLSLTKFYSSLSVQIKQHNHKSQKKNKIKWNKIK